MVDRKVFLLGKRGKILRFLSITFLTCFSAEQQIFLHTHGARVGVLRLNGMEDS